MDEVPTREVAMGVSRLFWPQELLDQWILDEIISLDGKNLTIQKEQKTYQVTQAVYFTKDVGDGNDAHKLLGRVKALEDLQEMGAEHYMDSVIIEDSAYEVVSGFLGELASVENAAIRSAGDITGAIAEHAGNGDERDDDKELLAKFLIENL